MTYHTHFAFSILFAFTVIKNLNSFQLHNYFDFEFLLILYKSSPVNLYCAAALGAILPDIDHVNSRIGNKLKPISWIIKLFGIKHRGLTHSILGVFLFSILLEKLLLINWIDKIWYYSLLIGYISHLIADMFNPLGIPILYPNEYRFKFGINITTGSWKENTFFSITILILFIIFIIELGYYNISFSILN
ncbi:metal-dependent hydrolase [Selenihalanaerobacter shriftii]|uniref:Inner membrane protein n=1 Tax=Selenihalanaerobacter shriftii TaxID=142842 RepID=A0A1T4LUB1_9FIRM|nr:metal-dependent hydrolase [Selenihalanaerobacter shriftii]SJZ58118.1 inner membrane protein [Selenihalanaerobacter shriftii]